jgi:protein phosphatase 2C-like protein
VWRPIAQSAQGRSHAADENPCQDSHIVRLIGEGAAQTLIACVGDGAGSAKFSDVGSNIICTTVVDNAAKFFELGGRAEDLGKADVLRWCTVARRKIKSAARSRLTEPRQMATTMLGAVFTPTCAAFFQVGDGAIVLRRNGVYGVAFWPQTGEYANSTNFVTSDNYKKRLEFFKSKTPFEDVALMTDGLERLALRFDTYTPHPPFFDPLFRALRATEDYSGLNDALGKFLSSDPVRERSDDDTTLILASRIVDGSKKPA